MTQDKQAEILFDISSKLGSIESKMSTLCTTIALHEQRLTILEKDKVKNSDDFKTEILKLIGKALIISLAVIASLTGAAGIVSKIFGI